MSAYNTSSDKNSNYLFDKDAWGVATLGLLFTSIVASVLLGIFFQSGLGKFTDGFTGFLLAVFLIIIGAFISFLLIKLFKLIPVFFKTTLGAVFFSLLVFVLLREDMRPGALFFLIFFLIVLQGILAGLIWVILSGRLRFVLYSIRIWARLIVLAIIVLDIGVYYLLAASDQDNNVVFTPKLNKKIIENLPNENVITDSYRISSFYYGSGNDQRRTTYNQGLSFVSNSFDLGEILPGATKYFSEKFKWFWGFDAANLPLNAQVWLPESDSLQAELVLIVHGDEALTSGLENGFGYMAEALSSMGYMVVIPDLNYFNSLWLSMPNNDKLRTQTIVLQQHLQALKGWNSNPEHKLYNRLDSMGIATVIGHGEGARLARELIKLSKVERLPYNANYATDVDFLFKGIIELAPVNSRNKALPIEDISHLAIHSGHSAVNRTTQTFLPLIRFTDTSQYYFSNSISIHKANYAQFNETLEGRDLRPPYNWFINQAAIMSGKDQRALTTNLIAAFLRVVSGQKEWLPVMQNTYYLANTPENTISFNQFVDNRRESLATFDEDADPITTTFNAAKIESKNFKIWKEVDYAIASALENKGLILGWDATGLKNLSAGMRKDSTATFSIIFSPDFNHTAQLSPNTTSFDFSMIYLGEDIDNKEIFSNDKNLLHDNLDFSIEFVDTIGIVNRIAFKHFATAVTPQMPVLYKIPWLGEGQQHLFLQSYSLSMDGFFAMNPEFNINTLAKINFVFDKTPKGKILLDNIGFRKTHFQDLINEEGLLEPER